MHRAGLVLLLVFALLATTLAVPAARAAKALGNPSGGQELSLAGTVAPRAAVPAKACLFAAGLLGCAFFQPAAPAQLVPAAFAAVTPPIRADRLPEGRPSLTPMRPPRLSA